MAGKINLPLDENGQERTLYELIPGQRMKLPFFVTDGKTGDDWIIIASNKEGLVDRIEFHAPSNLEQDTAYMVTGQMKTNRSERKTITISVKKKVEKPEKPRGKFVEIKEHGKDGKFFITVQIQDNKGYGYKCPIIFIEEKGEKMRTCLPDGKNPFKKSTNDSGFLIIELKPFTCKKIIHIRAQGTDLDKRLELEGPKAKKKTWQGKCDQRAGFIKNLLQK